MAEVTDSPRSGASREPVESLIRRHIREGRFAPGQRLIEVDLVKQFGVSQRQVREALRRLEAEGLVSIEKNRGASVRRVTRKAWRFAGEMEEIAATFRAAGLPGEFHDAAARVYERLAAYKDAEGLPALEEVLAAL